jgi:predicted glycosyltransferase
MIMDYEFARTPGPLRPRWEIVPEVLAGAELHCTRPDRVRTYRGIKEDVYVPEFEPDPSLRSELGLPASDVVVTIRPPANEAHYHEPETDLLFRAFMERLIRTPSVRGVLLPRHHAQEIALRETHRNWFREDRVIVPPRAVHGLNLLWHSDLVVGAGGTMNREAAALGVPAYSLFRGPIGSVDRYLAGEGRLVLIESLEDVERKIRFERSIRSSNAPRRPPTARREVLDHIEAILQAEHGGAATAVSEHARLS